MLTPLFVVPALRRALFTSLAVVATSVSAFAQDATKPAGGDAILPRESAIEVRTRFLNDLDTLNAKVIALAEAIPADKFSWRPAEGVRSVGEAFLHVASEYYVFTPMSYGGTASPIIPRSREGFQNFEKDASKENVLKQLKEGYAYMKSQLNGLDAAKITGTQKLFGGDRTIIETSFIMSGDLHEHLGQLIAYARANGVRPPWSK